MEQAAVYESIDLRSSLRSLEMLTGLKVMTVRIPEMAFALSI
jgi:hypothetical protein